MRAVRATTALGQSPIPVKPPLTRARWPLIAQPPIQSAVLMSVKSVYRLGFNRRTNMVLLTREN